MALTPKEFDLLAFLADDAGAVRPRQELLENVWDPHWYGPTKTLDVHVASLRKKLGDPGWIETVRGVGFRLRAARRVTAARGEAAPALQLPLDHRCSCCSCWRSRSGVSYANSVERRLTSDLQHDAFSLAIRSQEPLDRRRRRRRGQSRALQALADRYHATARADAS